MTFKKRLIRTAILSSIALIIGVGVGFYQLSLQEGRKSKNNEAIQASPPVAGVKIGGPYSLVNGDGEKVTEQKYLNDYKLIYFGFTYCPAICPTELQRMTKAIDMLPEEMAAKIQPLFITVDPDRDTPEVMKDYVSLFHPRLVGLTGTQPQIDFVLKSYRIFATKVDDPAASDYTMDHSTFTYLMGPGDQLLSIYRTADTAEFMAEDIRKKIEARENPA